MLSEGFLGKVYEVEYNGIKYIGKKFPKLKLNNDKSKKDLKKEIDVLRKMKDCKNSVKYFSHFDDKEN